MPRVTKHTDWQQLALLILLIVCSGASCPRRDIRSSTAGPTVFFSTPTADQIVQVVNANTAKVRQLQTTAAKLEIPGAPDLRCTLALERPLRFRMRGDTIVTGNELDMGSNDEVFWLWARRNRPPAVYFANHRDYRPGMAAALLPLPPTWLIEAMGLIELDPNAVYEGPTVSSDGRMTLRYLTPGETTLTKVLTIDNRLGHVLQQEVYDLQGTLLASAQMSDHRFDPQYAVALPHVVTVSLPPAEMVFSFKIDSYMINGLTGDPLTLWAMPQMPGTQYLDLARQPLAGQP